jgi:uncharacterized protein (DUF2062 family)
VPPIVGEFVRSSGQFLEKPGAELALVERGENDSVDELGAELLHQVALGAVTAAVMFGLVMFVIWSIGSMYRRAGERARDPERAVPPSRRARRRYVQGR